MTLSRHEERQTFLASIGWQDATELRTIGDASTRSYRRLKRGVEQAILMDAPVAAESAACPPEASPAERGKLGYNALARLAGPNLHAFTELAALLRKAGLHAPEIYAADADQGFSLMEDLGDALYAQVIPAGEDETALYLAAIEALVKLQSADQERPVSDQYTLLDYDAVAMQAETALLTEWYWPFIKGGAPSEEALQAYREVWQACLAQLSAPGTLVLRDYHAENILWLAGKRGLDRVGIIDFQDGLFGHGAYDVVSLLEDARRDVSEKTVSAARSRYIEAMSTRNAAFNADIFETDYAVLAAQRNAKILGIFARLVKRDGKDRYVEFMPRVRAHFAHDLARAPLSPVRDWAQHYFPELLQA